MIRRQLIFLFFIISNTILAQSYIGFKGGINHSISTYIFNIKPADIIGRGDLDGFYFSVPLEMTINDLFEFSSEIGLISEGSVISVQSMEDERTYSNNILYIKMPILAKLKLLKHKTYTFNLKAGLNPAYALGVKSYYFALSDLRRTVNVPITFQEAGIKRYDLGLSIGINTEKLIARGWKITLDIRYNLGLLDIENHSSLTTTTESFNLTLGILTPLFKDSEKQLSF